MNSGVNWPDGKDFAFTVFDDTDRATLENVREVYSFLSDSGFRTTKSVWPVLGNQEPEIGTGWVSGSTCEDQDYVEWIKELQDSGFEIGYHSTTFHRSLRNEVIFGLQRFYELFGHYPKSMAQHDDKEGGEAIYWGNYRVTGINEHIYNLLTKYKYKGIFRGHFEEDRYFWGDICKEKIKYVRNFVFSDINTLKACPIMPYHDPLRPYVNYWFASSEGCNVNSFTQCLTEQNQDRLEEERGACIMYTHFAFGFYRDNAIDSRFKFLMSRLSKKNGWFVPVSTLLDYLLEVNDHHNITDKERRQLERRWLFHKMRVGTT